MNCPICSKEMFASEFFPSSHYCMNTNCVLFASSPEEIKQVQKALAAARADGEQRGTANVVSYIETWEPLLLSFYDDTERETFERLKSEMIDNTHHYFSMQPRPAEAGPK